MDKKTQTKYLNKKDMAVQNCIGDAGDNYILIFNRLKFSLD